MMRNWLRFAASLVLVIVVSDFAVGALGPRFPDPVVWHTQTAQAKVALVESEQAETLLTGTSQVMQGLDPAAFHGPTLNVGLSSGTPELQRPWLLNEVTTRSRPRVIVWGVNALIDFQSSDQKPDVVARYEEAPATNPSLGFQVAERLAPWSNIAEDRAAWSAYSWVEALTPKPPPGPPQLDGRGFRTSFDQTPTEVERSRWQSLLNGYAFDPGEDFSATIEDLNAHGIHVVVVEMPIPQRLIDLLPRGRAQYDSSRKQLKATVADLGVQYVEHTDDHTANSHFVDFTHFGEQGAWEFSQFVAAAVALKSDPVEGGS